MTALVSALAGLPYEDRWNLVREMINEAEACWNERLMLTADDVTNLVTGLNTDLPDYPDVDASCLYQAAEFIQRQINSLPVFNASDEWGRGLWRTVEEAHRQAVEDFVESVCLVDTEPDNDDDQFPLHRNALAAQRLLNRVGALSIFSEAVSLLRQVSDVAFAPRTDNWDAGGEASEDLEDACYNASEDLDFCYDETGHETSEAVWAAVRIVDCCLGTFSTSLQLPVDRFRECTVFDDAVTWTATLRNELPFNYVAAYAVATHAGRWSGYETDPRLASLAESYLDSGLHAELFDAMDEAVAQLARLDELTDLNRAASQP